VTSRRTHEPLGDLVKWAKEATGAAEDLQLFMRQFGELSRREPLAATEFLMRFVPLARAEFDRFNAERAHAPPAGRQ
jgi:hypothetical protein